MEKIKKSSIEVKDCMDYGVNYKDDLGNRFEEEEKRQKEFSKQREKQEKQEAKQRQRKDKQEARKAKTRNARKPRQPRRQRKNRNSPPPVQPNSNSPNCEEIFVREGIIDSNFPPNITQEIKESIQKKWRKWTILNHPDKKKDLSPEEYVKQTELFKEITGCKDMIMEDKYVPQQQGCNVM